MDETPRPERISTPAIEPVAGAELGGASAVVRNGTEPARPVAGDFATAASDGVRDSAPGRSVSRAMPLAGAALDVGARSDVGRIRKNNEDNFALAPDLNLFVLSDGMGGQASGEVASQLAANTIVAHLRETRGRDDVESVGEPVRGASETSNRLLNAVRMANREVRRAAEANLALRGMGATVVAMQIVDGRISIAHVGDSRAYRLRGGVLEQLTHDHSFVAEQVRQGMMTQAEADASKMQNVLLRALGSDPRVEVELNEELAIDGDALLLCSDGLTRELTDAQIAAIIDDTASAQEAADRLVEFANRAGGGDNITAIVIRYGEKPGGTLAKLGRWFKGAKK